MRSKLWLQYYNIICFDLTFDSIFKDRVLIEYNEMKKVLYLDASVKSKDKAQIVVELFNVKLDTCSTVLFQRFDNDWGEYIDVEINDLQNKDKVKVKIRQDNQDCGSVQVNLSVSPLLYSLISLYLSPLPPGAYFFRPYLGGGGGGLFIFW